MKYIFSLLLVCSSFFSFSQMTVGEMIKVYKMDLDEFETYAINKGFKFNGTEDNENVFSVSYVKGVGDNTKYLSLDTRSYGIGNRVTYQTANNKEFATFKNELKVKGFILADTRTFNGSIVKKYILKDWVFEIYSGVDDAVYFEINLTKP